MWTLLEVFHSQYTTRVAVDEERHTRRGPPENGDDHESNAERLALPRLAVNDSSDEGKD